MTQEKTKAEQFLEIAEWLKRQDTEFTKNFKSMNSIIRIWKLLPENSKRSNILKYFAREKQTQYLKGVMMAFNAEFDFRYFTKANYRYIIRMSYREWQFRGNTHMEVRLSRYDAYKGETWGDVLIEIKDKTQAKTAAEKLIKNNTEKLAHDMEIVYSDRLKKLMEQSKPTDEPMQEVCEIPSLARYGL